nr:Ig-like domain-containing protein [Bacteroidota bacterium]
MKNLNLLLKFVMAMIITIAISAYASAQTPFNYCLEFDGTDDYVNGSGIVTPFTNITIEAWVKHKTLPAGQIQRYVTIGPEMAVLRYEGSGPDRLHFYVRQSNGVLYSILVDNVLASNEWIHVAGTYDGTTMKLYANGTEIGSANPDVGGLYPCDGNFSFSAGAGETLNGSLDEIRVWDVVRSQEEISQNMNIPFGGTETGLVACWKLDDGTGSVASDSAGSSDGTLYNMTEDDWIVSTVPYFWGAPGTALAFDGSSEYVNTTLDDLSGSEITIEYWFKGSSTQSAVRQQDATNYIVAGWGDLHILSNDGGVGDGLPVGAGAEDGNWHHIAMTWKQNTVNGFVTYLDGEVVASRTSSNTPIPNISASVLFGSFDGTSEFMNGRLDEIRIWNIARSQSEIVQTMQSFLQGNETGLISYWQLNEGFGTLTYDYAGAYQGTLFNMDETNWVSSEIPPVYSGAGTALDFTESNDHVSFDPLWATSPDEITFEAWYRNFTSTVEDQCLIYHGDNGEFRLTTNSGFFAAAVRLSDGNWYEVSTSYQFNRQWQHIACTWKRNESLKLFVNGSVRNEITVPDLNLYDPGSGYLPSFGKLNRVSNKLYGVLDEVRIWNVARTETELRDKMFSYLNGSESGLLGNWKFNEGSGITVYDIAGGHNGTLHGFISSDWVESGIPAMTTGRGNATEMNYLSDYFRVDGSSNYGSGLYLSIEAWIKPIDSDPDQIVVSKFPWDNSGFLLAIKQGQLQVRMGNGTTTYTILGGQIPSNEWTHIAATWDIDAGALIAYVNGIAVGAETVSGYVDANNSKLIVGAASWATNQYQFYGQIDEVRLWNETRTPKEIATNMHAVLTGTEDRLVSYWQFNAGSGSFCYDFTGGYDAVSYGWKMYVNSTFPLGVSYEQSIPYTYTGRLDFPGTDFSMNINQAWAAKTFVVTKILDSPLDPPALADVLLDIQYWKIWQNNTHPFDADFTFTVIEDMMPNDELYPYDVKLFNRPVLGEYWQIVKGASHVYPTGDSLLYTNIGSFGDLVLGRLVGPLATDFSPIDEATDVYIRENLVITFNKNVVADTGYVIIKHTSDDSVFESFVANELEIQNNQVIIDPQDNFIPVTEYYVIIDGHAFKDTEDKYFEGFMDAGSWNFTTSDHPLIESFTPADNETGISKLTELLIDFDRDIFAGSGNIYIKKAADSSLFETISTSSATIVSDVASFDPLGILDAFTEYFIQIDSNAFHDISMNNFAGIQKAGTWNFSTSEFPLVDNFIPANDSIGIKLRSNIQITFDRNVVAGAGNVFIFNGQNYSLFDSIQAVNTIIN